MKRGIVLMVILGVLGLMAVSQIAQAQAPDYVGSQVCKTCHSTIYDSWKQTRHNMKFRDPDEGLGVIPKNDFVNGLDLSTTPAFAAYGSNAPVLSYDNTDPQDPADETSGYRVTIAGKTYTVNYTLGGTGLWKQRFVTKIGQSLYILPIQYNEKTGEWVTYHASAWYDANNQPLANVDPADSYDRRCAGCHNTGVTVDFDQTTGEWIAHWVERNVACEACHGPGGPGGPNSTNHSAFGLPGKGMNPDKDIDGSTVEGKFRRLEVCGACHGRGSSTAVIGGKNLGYPYKEGVGQFTPGNVLAEYYTQNPGYWPNEMPWGKFSKAHHQQYDDMLKSPHAQYNPDKPWIDLSCWTCHDPHEEKNEHQVVTEIDEDGVVIPTEADNNTLCLACHSGHGPFAELTKETIANITNPDSLAKVAAVVTKHTHHSYDPENANGTGGASRCTKCHMPKIAKSAIPYDIHSHMFYPPSPEQTLYYANMGGAPNACAVSCHRNPTEPNIPDFDITDNSLTDWTEASDLQLARALMAFYGPGGVWWDTGQPLPVELASFKLNVGDGYVALTWRTESETNNAGFEVERKVADEDHFQTIGFVKGAGTTSEPQEYSFYDNDVRAGMTYYYRIKQVDLDGKETYSGVLKAVVGVPKTYALDQNYPNPFNPSTTIRYAVKDPGRVTLKVYNMMGQEVKTVVDGFRNPGIYKVTLDASDMSAGIYFYKLTVNDFTAVKKMILAK